MAQCPAGYAPRLFWPSSHFYGFMGNERNLWCSVYRATQRSPRHFCLFVGRGRIAISYRPAAGSSLSLPLPPPPPPPPLFSSHSFSSTPHNCSSYFPKLCRERESCWATATDRRQLFPLAAPGTMVTPFFVSAPGSTRWIPLEVALVQS